MGALNCHQARQKPGALARPRRKRGGSSFQTNRLLQLAPNILSDVLWALSGCAGDSRVFKPISALRGTARGLRETLDQSQFWPRKVNFILTAYSAGFSNLAGVRFCLVWHMDTDRLWSSTLFRHACRRAYIYTCTRASTCRSFMNVIMWYLIQSSLSHYL